MLDTNSRLKTLSPVKVRSGLDWTISQTTCNGAVPWSKQWSLSRDCNLYITDHSVYGYFSPLSMFCDLWKGKKWQYSARFKGFKSLFTWTLFRMFFQTDTNKMNAYQHCVCGVIVKLMCPGATTIRFDSCNAKYFTLIADVINNNVINSELSPNPELNLQLQSAHYPLLHRQGGMVRLYVFWYSAYNRY